jgi:SAM-dependent methyltransferase
MQLVGTALSAGGLRAVGAQPPVVAQSTKYVGLRCPTCTTNLAAMAYHALGQKHDALECRNCSASVRQERRIWMALAANRLDYFERFIRDYEAVRRAEGRGSGNPAFYLSLPYVAPSDIHAWQWSIRAQTYRYFERKILPFLNSRSLQPLTILDLGAGNGWLSYRLATLGHRPVAVDLQTNAFDGLAAAVHYRHALPMVFPRFQAELDRLPFADHQFDCAIFNASFHYSENYDRTLSEAIRCLRRRGTVIIADTPFYKSDESGQRMLAERRVSFQKRFGFASDSLASCEYLTKERLLSLEGKHRLEWTAHEVWYGFRWACRPWVAKLKGRREPSQFRIYTAQVKTR